MRRGRRARGTSTTSPKDDAVQRLDLGGLRVPVPPGIEVRVDVNAEGEVVAATLVHKASSMQVNVFAAPSAPASGTRCAPRSRSRSRQRRPGPGRRGPHGQELFAAVPVQGGGAAPARFIGVDGPRWFVRALLTGPAAQDRVGRRAARAALRGSSSCAARRRWPCATRCRCTCRARSPSRPPRRSRAGAGADGEAALDSRCPSAGRRSPRSADRGAAPGRTYAGRVGRFRRGDGPADR